MAFILHLGILCIVLVLVVDNGHAFSTNSLRHNLRSHDALFDGARIASTRRDAYPTNQGGGSLPLLPNIRAAVIVPGFLTGKDEFLPLAQSLNNIGIPTVVVPMPNWHWLPCLGGRSMRPMLERIDFTVRHLAGVAGNLGDFERTTMEAIEKSLDNDEKRRVRDPQILIPNINYNVIDLYQDFRNNPGGVLKVGGSAEVDKYPLWNPKGSFLSAPAPMGKVALIGHSAGGWICRAYLSNRNYGGKSYDGQKLVHSLITLGSPHGNAPGPAFKGVEWVNSEIIDASSGVRALAVGGTGYKGDSSGDLTRGAYSFCCPVGSDGTQYDGDGVTPIQSALAMKEYMPHADTLVLDDVGHFCWSDVFGGDIVAPDLTKFHRDGRPWYGDEPVIEKWAGWLIELCGRGITMVLSQEDVDGCRQAFLSFDKDKSGTIDVWELRQVLEAMGQRPTEDELFQMINEVDDNMSGSIDFGEFLKVVEGQKNRAATMGDENDMIDAFAACGGRPDKSGHVKKETMIKIIKHDFGLTIDVEELFNKIDEDGSGEIDFYEFSRMLGK